MSTPCPAPLLAIVVKGGTRHAAAHVVDRIVRRLNDARLAATWIVNDDAETRDLSASGALARGDAALAVANAALALEGAAAPQFNAELARRLEQIRATGVVVASLATALDMSRSTRQRALHLLGVRAIVTEAPSAAPAAVRPLPFGIWQLAPQAVTPARRGWLAWPNRRPRVRFDLLRDAAQAVLIEPAGLSGGRRASWRDFESFVDDSVGAAAEGRVVVATLSDVALQLTGRNAARPQRSILRAA